jgi:transcriptional regulator with XRE-family HTH domain
LPNKQRDEHSMNAQDVVIGLRRYLSESEDDQHEIATKIGVSWITLSAWLTGESEPHKRILARVAGFLKRIGYL